MAGSDSGKRRVKITAEVVVEILDETALEREAVKQIDTVEFYVTDDSDSTVDQVRAAEREAVVG
jgi:hypothetical protein